MQALKVCGLAAVLLAPLQPAVAQETCVPGPNALGVSRTVAIDTSTGPRFGGKHKESELLADREVVLTFDDGPSRSHTKAVLDALSAHCTKATFFVVGRMAVADPEMVREYDRRGHTVGTHTWSHQNLRSVTPLKARHEIELGFSAVQQAMGKPIAPFFRFPYLSDPNSMVTHMQGRQIAMFGVDVDSKDYRTRDGAAVQRKVMADLAVAKKGIILFHDIQTSTARGLPGLLAELKAKGYRIVHFVPMAEATTMPAFDAIAQSAFAHKHAASVNEPLAKRSMTWPVANTGLPTSATAVKVPAGSPEPAASPQASPGPARPAPRTREPAPTDWKLDVWRW